MLDLFSRLWQLMEVDWVSCWRVVPGTIVRDNLTCELPVIMCVITARYQDISYSKRGEYGE